jgi:alpha-L-fucosidase
MLVNTVARGGNLLMNVGPTALGTFDDRAVDALGVYEDWMARHADAIYGCTMSEFEEPQDCRLTQNGDKLYVHIFAWPFKHLYLEGLGDQVAFARFLHDGSEVSLKLSDWTSRHLQAGENTLVLELPVVKPDVVVPVIELELKS